MTRYIAVLVALAGFLTADAQQLVRRAQAVPEFVQHGCTSYYGKRFERRSADATYGTGGSGFDPRKCSTACKDMGFKYFGYECPMNNRVHCQCYDTNRVENIFDNAEPKVENCKALVGRDGDKHCKGPAMIDGMSTGGADIGSIYMVADYKEPEPEPPVEDWPEADFVQHGCTGYYGKRSERRSSDTKYNADGSNFNPRQCSDACLGMGYKYFGYECPMDNHVHCQCYGADRVEILFDNAEPKREDCKALVGRDGDKHCKGPNMIDGMSIGGADIGSIYMVADYKEPEPEPRVEDWPEAEFVQHGCTSYYGKRFERRSSDTKYNADGSNFNPRQCSDACLDMGYKYFGYECPMNNRVHCQCYDTNRVENVFDNAEPKKEDCKALVGRDGDKHCKGPNMIDGMSIGGADIGSIYMVGGIEEAAVETFALEEAEEVIDWSEAEYEQLGCTSYYGHRFDRRAANVKYQEGDGEGFEPGQCNDACLDMGYKYFGFECPMNRQVHCQCYSADKIDNEVERANCKAKVGKDGDKHCTGPAVINGISTGGADIGSIYKVKGYGPDVPGFNSRLGQCRGAVCNLWGDPHINTCDGLAYDCQANGIVTLMKNELYNIQANFVHPPGRNYVTITNDVAIQHVPSGKRLQFSFLPDLENYDSTGEFFELGPECPVLFYVDGELQDINKNLEGSDGYFYGDAGSDHSARLVGQNEIRVVQKHESGGVSEAHLRVNGFGPGELWSCHWNYYVCLPSEQHELVVDSLGLLGTPDGDAQNDWMDVNGNSLTIPDADRYRAAFEYCHDWCVAVDDSIMAYPEGTSHEDRTCVEDEPYEFALDDDHCVMHMEEAREKCSDKPKGMFQSCLVECCNGGCDTIDQVIEEILDVVTLSDDEDDIIFDIRDPEKPIPPIVDLQTEAPTSGTTEAPTSADIADVIITDDEECSKHAEAILMETIGKYGDIQFDSSSIIIKDGNVDEVTFSVKQVMADGIPMASFSYRAVGEDMKCDMETMDDGSMIPYGALKEITAQCLKGYAELGVFIYVGNEFDIAECESCSAPDDDYVGFYFSIPCTPLCEEEISPTVAPLRTDDPTSFIEEADTEPPLEPPEVNCPEDILLLRKIGVTDYPTNEAVKIVSQDKGTVKVELNQAWAADGTIDSIFAYYRETVFDKRCYETAEVEAGDFETIEIYCNVFSPKAQLEICVADTSLDVGDNAEVPKCCEPSFPPNTPVVCYTLEINCVSECIDESQQRQLRGGTEK
jgi:hypothetical protein